MGDAVKPERGRLLQWMDRMRVKGIMDSPEELAKARIWGMGDRSVHAIVSVAGRERSLEGKCAYLVGIAAQLGFDCSEAMPLLRRLLFDQVDPIEKRAAAMALASVGSEEAFVMLKDALHCDSSITKQVAAIGLGMMRGKFAEKAREELEHAVRRDGNMGVQIAARRSLTSWPPQG